MKKCLSLVNSQMQSNPLWPLAASDCSFLSHVTKASCARLSGQEFSYVVDVYYFIAAQRAKHQFILLTQEKFRFALLKAQPKSSAFSSTVELLFSRLNGRRSNQGRNSFY